MGRKGFGLIGQRNTEPLAEKRKKESSRNEYKPMERLCEKGIGGRIVLDESGARITCIIDEAQYGLDRHNAIAVADFLKNKLDYIKKETAGQYVQGQDICPICGGTVDYTWSQFHGFTVFECSKNDCLPFPSGGAKKRREAGLPKIISTRFRRGN